ncbi:FecR family protein [Methylobacillus caricis]|uniref:FecR domain-containing protein n=1 Tax=Methylobacillus caricis TaxID=1971611 RepID=UPI001CFFBA8F|nr:FecR family protein [Methylobacillus caricis]MCB5187792.1 FecR family protein [Methylobacillus caricis]
MAPTTFSPEISKAAAEWLTLSMDAGFGPQDAERLQQWRNADPEHERAWQHIESMNASLHRLNTHAAYQTLSTLHSASRRSTLKALAWLGMLAGTGVLASRTEQWQLQIADYSTGTGELKELALSDDTQIVLNTRSAIDVKFTDTARIVTLLNGEIMVTTGHQANEHRPFRLLTVHGYIQPLGTQFNVKLAGDSTEVTVLEGAVNIVPMEGANLVAHAGEQTSFTTNHAYPASAIPAQTGAWRKGLLFANDMRLADLAQELGRYRPGFIRCDDAVADLRISGVFTLNDTTQALEAITNSLPVSIIYRTRYWVRITASHA